jgi:predicted RNA-binding Zn-ribbon protein involved in translation (DUF1610 family)
VNDVGNEPKEDLMTVYSMEFHPSERDGWIAAQGHNLVYDEATDLFRCPSCGTYEVSWPEQPESQDAIPLCAGDAAISDR